MVRLLLLGLTVVQSDGRASSAHLAGRPRQVLEILALEAGSPVAKDRLADLLWEGNPPASYVGTLESYVCLVRRHLGAETGRRSALATTPHGYVLDLERVSVDVNDFRGHFAAAATSTAAVAVARTQQALDLITGDLLASEPYAAWAIRAREQLSGELVAACLRAAQLAAGIGDFPSAVRMAKAAVAHDPLCEQAWQQLMRVYWFLGLRVEALRAWSQLREAMIEDLGEEPGVDSRELYLAILRDNPVDRVDSSADDGMELRLLLGLLRQAIDVAPGVEAPAQDAALSGVALRVLELC